MKKLMKKIGLQFFGAGAVVNGTASYVNAGTGETTSFSSSSGTDGFTYNGLTPEMRTYYSDYLIDIATPILIHEQFAQKKPIPKNNGKTINFRRYDPLPKITTALSEGVTPNGQKMSVGDKTATVYQYGGYIEITDVLLLTAVDNNIVEATQLIGNQAGRSCDTIVREVINAGTNVQYGANAVSARYALTTSHKMSVDCIRRAVRNLKNNLAQKINGTYVAIIHPDVAYDLMSDNDWKYPHQYVDTKNIYSGEIGQIAGVRFVETTEAKVFHADDLISGGLSVKTAIESSTTTVAVKEAISSAQATALAGRKCIIGTNLCTIASASAAAAGSATLTLSAAITAASANATIYPGEAGAQGRDVYSTIVLGANAYGVSEVTGGGLRHIVKQLGSAGTADPLDQRATVGWKRLMAVCRLVETYMVRIETTSTFEAGAN